MLWTVSELSLTGKSVFIRVDFNVPVKDGIVQDDTRIMEALKTINYVLEKGGKPVLGAHFGRPKGKDPVYSLKVVAEHINKKGYFKAVLVEDCIGAAVKSAIAAQKSDEVLLLENLRFYPGEEKNESEFVKSLAAPFEIFINDAFGVSHRKHASVYGVPLVIKNKGAGFLIEKEVKYFEKIVTNPEKPFAAILGGAKVSDKIGVITSLLDKADKIFIGGAMAYTFLKCLGHSTGTSLVEDAQMDTVNKIIKKANEKGGSLYLPKDHIVSDKFGGAPVSNDSIDIKDGFMGLDIGSKTVEYYKEALSDCKTVLWNGPMGVFEQDNYAKGTFGVANYLAELKATVVIGGGDSVSAINKAGVAGRVAHISTGGGASLEYLEFGTLPGIDVLRK